MEYNKYKKDIILCNRKYIAEQISEYATHLKESAKTRREKDNIFITPEDLRILNVPLRDFVLDNKIPVFKRRTVIEAMGESGLPHNGRILVYLLDEDIHILLKKSIIYALGRMRFGPAEDILLEYTRNRNPHLRMRAVEALGHIGGTRYLKRIGEMVSDKNAYVSARAVKSLGEVGHPDGLKFLENLPAGSFRWLKVTTDSLPPIR